MDEEELNLDENDKDEEKDNEKTEEEKSRISTWTEYSNNCQRAWKNPILCKP